jgi:conjugative transposon TraM protein
MEEHNNNRGSVRLTEVSQNESTDTVESSQDRLKRLRKPIIFTLMAIVFVACMYMIFVPAGDKKDAEQIGLNEAVPQATDAGMQADKGKAYENEQLEEKELEKKKSLSALSDYWNVDSAGSQVSTAAREAKTVVPVNDHQNQALSSYRNIQGTLGNFYEDRGEATQLQNEVRSLKSQLAKRESTVRENPVESQLALMEKSYQMAAKYFPVNGTTVKPEQKENSNTKDSTGKTGQKISFAALYPVDNQIVSALYREPSDSAWLADLGQEKNRNFYTAGKTKETFQTANSIRACIHESQTIIAGGTVRIRLLAPVKIAKLVIPKGTVLTGIGKFQGTRLQLQIGSIESQGNIIPVEIAVYDMDGQLGLAVPVSPERSAITETIANMGNSSGTNVSLSSTAGQQITTDLSKSLVQGISGYFSKKVRTPKVTLKAGYQVFLVAKK